MPLRSLFSVFDNDGKHIQALIQSMPRSFKMHVWANYREINAVETTDLKYLGTIQPIDQTDLAEVNVLVSELFEKEYHKIVD